MLDFRYQWCFIFIQFKAMPFWLCFFGTVEYIHVSLLVESSPYVCCRFAMCLDECDDMDSGDVCLYFCFNCIVCCTLHCFFHCLIDINGV